MGHLRPKGYKREAGKLESQFVSWSVHWFVSTLVSWFGLSSSLGLLGSLSLLGLLGSLGLLVSSPKGYKREARKLES